MARQDSKIVEGFRPGTLFHTKAGQYRNGSAPSKEQADYLKDQGYRLVAARADEEQPAATPIFSDMRSKQLDVENEAQVKVDEVRSKLVATGG